MKKIKIKLENADCFDFLKQIKTNSIDLVCVDPPYQISKETGFTKGEKKGNYTDRFRVSMDYGSWDKKAENDLNFQTLCNEFYRVLKKSGTIIIFWDLWKIQDMYSWLTNSGFKQLRFIEWLKTNPVPINSKINYLTNAREIAISAVKGGRPVFHSEYDNGIYNFPIEHGKDRFHPTQKSLKLIEALIEKHSNKKDLVLDCFSGSGTTAVACQNTNRGFVGCELDKTYFKKSIERIKKNETKKS